jgi:hypothetical protein
MATTDAANEQGGATSGGQIARNTISFTLHARRRSARRNVAPDAVEYVLAYGRMIQRTGVMFFFLGHRDIPACDRCASWAARLEGTIVLVAPDGTVITVYRNRRGWRPIVRKMKYRLPERDQPGSDDNGEDREDNEGVALTTARATA